MDATERATDAPRPIEGLQGTWIAWVCCVDNALQDTHAEYEPTIVHDRIAFRILFSVMNKIISLRLLDAIYHNKRIP